MLQSKSERAVTIQEQKGGRPTADVTRFLDISYRGRNVAVVKRSQDELLQE